MCVCVYHHANILRSWKLDVCMYQQANVVRFRGWDEMYVPASQHPYVVGMGCLDVYNITISVCVSLPEERFFFISSSYIEADCFLT